MGPQFFQTGMGQKFFEVTVPRMVKALERIADALEEQNKPIIEVAAELPPGFIICDECKSRIRGPRLLREVGLTVVSDEARAEHKDECSYGRKGR